MTNVHRSVLSLQFLDADVQSLVGAELTLMKRNGRIVYPAALNPLALHQAQAIVAAIEDVLKKPLEWRLK